jgi:hypothetical protein
VIRRAAIAAAVVLGACAIHHTGLEEWDAAERRRAATLTYLTGEAPPCPDGVVRVHDDGSWIVEVYCARGTVRDGAIDVWYVGPAWDARTRIARGRYAHGRRDGTWTYAEENGDVGYEGAFAGGEYDGSWKVKAGGRVIGTMSFARGTGTWTEWSASGQRVAEGRCVDGLRDGAWTWSDGKGGAAEVRTFARGVAEGPWRMLGESGEPDEGAMHAGARDGAWTEWIRAGEAGSHEYVGLDGQLHLSPASSDPTLRWRGAYRDGVRVGRWDATTADDAAVRSETVDLDPTAGGALPGHVRIDAALGRCQPFSDASPDPTIALDRAGADAAWEVELTRD